MSSEIINPSSQLISFPSDGSRKTEAEGGKYVLDFDHGIVTSPLGETEEMNKTLAQLNTNFVRSVFITVSTVDAVIKIGQNILPKSHQLTFVVNGISFDTMEITFPLQLMQIQLSLIFYLLDSHKMKSS
jgi:hypothetical protein